MCSVGPNARGFKQGGGGYFMPTSGTTGQGSVVINLLTPGTGAGGSATPPTFAANPTTWAGMTALVSLSTLNAADGSFLRDMGKTLISSGRTFRKVQLVKASLSTPTGSAPGTTPQQDYATGYLEVGVGAGVAPPKVTYYPVIY